MVEVAIVDVEEGESRAFVDLDGVYGQGGVKEVWVGGRGGCARVGGVVKYDGDGGEMEVVGTGSEGEMGRDEDAEKCFG